MIKGSTLLLVLFSGGAGFRDWHRSYRSGVQLTVLCSILDWSTLYLHETFCPCLRESCWLEAELFWSRPLVWSIITTIIVGVRPLILFLLFLKLLLGIVQPYRCFDESWGGWFHCLRLSSPSNGPVASSLISWYFFSSFRQCQAWNSHLTAMSLHSIYGLKWSIQAWASPQSNLH